MEEIVAAARLEQSSQEGRSAGAAPISHSPDSPFDDGYDIAAERDALADLVAGGEPDQADPRWVRFLELRAREIALRLRRRRATPHAVDVTAAGAQMATRAPNPGQLADATPDTMTLHTKDAYRLFTGRSAGADAKLPPIPGAKRFAAVLKSIWHLSANDNPYADWILIRMYDGLVAIRARLAQLITAREEAINLLRRKGLSLSVMGSRSPKTVELGFRSPYGYATAEIIVEFDYYVRMIKTLIHKDRMSDEEGRVAIRGIGRELRALFLEPIRWERHLLREELRLLSRSDFLPAADEMARLRVRAAVALFGEVPRKVFTGSQAPRHTRRNIKLTDTELRLLEHASLSVTEGPHQPDTGLL